VPGDPIMVVATSGLAQIKPAFDKSFLGRLVADKNVQKFAQDILNQGLKLAGEDMPDADMIKEIQGYVNDVAQNPILLGVGQLTDPQGPVPVHAYLYIDASKNKAKMQALLTKFNEDVVGADKLVQKEIQGVTLYGPGDDESVPGYWGWVGDTLVLGVNDAEGLAVKALQSGGTSMMAPLAKLPSHGDAFVEYLDYERVLGLILSLQTDQDAAKMMSLLYTKLGVANIKTIGVRAGFDGPNLVLDSSVGLKGPRAGLQAQLKPVSSETLSMVPAEAMAASVSHFDIPGTYDMAIEVADEMTQGQATQMVDMGVGMVMSQFGVDVREAIIKNLDGPMLGYAIPQGVMSEAMNGGPVGILTLKDPDAFAQMLLTVEKLGTSLAQGQFQAGTQEVGGLTLHTWAVGPLAMMQMVPTWTVVDNKYFVISTDTSLCAAAAKQAAGRARATSLLSSDAFKKASGDVPKEVLTLNFVDTKNQIKQMMNGLQRLWPMGAMLAGTQGVQLPMMLPPLDHLMTDLVPVCNYSVDKDGGIYSHYEGTGVEMAVGAGIGAGVGFAMPMIMGSRSQAFAPAPEAVIESVPAR
ncbi:MAG: DUF3352 domain-containing protein, partial [Planctomycetes bacterium]|nr:DUF3352 domain-containing protein [Planctomycetota bacterium]